ncbi:MAG TPA: ATP-binding protein [Kofleriaceae bacterium]|jgi:signal transduction histidine kinase|nr:ATP-binding protein [Kofleriaceae bacterium]
MKLRGRFTLALALAALVPISIAAVLTREVIAERYRTEYAEHRRVAEDLVQRGVDELKKQVKQVAAGLVSHDDRMVGRLLLDLAKAPASGLDYEQRRALEQNCASIRSELALDVLTIAEKGRILCAPHAHGKVGESNHRELRDHAIAGRGEPFFALEDITTEGNGKIGSQQVLVAEAAQTAQDGAIEVVVAVGRRVDDKLLDPVRDKRWVDARIVSATGDVLVPPNSPRWAQLSPDPPTAVSLTDSARAPVARIEVAVSDGDMARVLRTVTLRSAAASLLALIGVVLIGLLVARRTARDLDQLVAGSLAAARGDLDHRVPVRSEDEIGAVARAFNFMMEDLRSSKERLVIAERIAAWQEIARRLAHEIKNPLTPIQMAMDTLRKTWKKQHPSFGEILEESTTTVMEEADRLKKIVSEFSGFARMPKPEFQRLDLNELVRSALTLYQGAAPIEIQLVPQLPRIDADKNQLNQVVLNLVENARDAIGQRGDGRITVATRFGEASDRVMLVVEDNGPGIPGDLKDKVFAPYFTTKHSKGGTGLGLAIVHRIVSDHGGRIAVADAPGGGARFAIELPLRNGTALLTSRI